MSKMIDERQLKILEVIESCLAGVGRHVRGLCEDIAEQGHQVTIAYAPHRMDEDFKRFVSGEQNGIRFVPLEIQREMSPLSDLRGVVDLRRLIKAEGPFDVVHGHSSKGGAIGRLAGRICRVSTIYTPHSLILSSPDLSRSKATVYTLIETALGRLATSRIIAVSEDEAEFILKLGLASKDRVSVIENAIVDREFESFEQEPVLEGISPGKPLTFGSTMRFSAQKAPGLLVDAFVRLSGMLPDLPMRLTIAGDGDLFSETERRIEEYGMEDRISLLGWRTDIRSLLQEMDVFVVPSLYESGLSYSTMEAMAARLPVVSSLVFGATEPLSRVQGNILVRAGDAFALADGMRRMATRASRQTLRRSLRTIGEANNYYVRKHFSQADVTRRTLDLYRALQ